MTLLDLCRLEDVRPRLDVLNTESDAILTPLISGVSAAIERYIDRSLFLEERTEYAHVFAPEAPVVLLSYPVTAIASVKNSTSWDWDNSTPIEADQYDVDPEAGVLYFRSRLDTGRRALEVVYTAGIGTTPEEVAASYPDLSLACVMQVVEEFRRKEHQGQESFSLSDGGAVAQTAPLMLLPAVKQRLKPWMRRVL